MSSNACGMIRYVWLESAYFWEESVSLMLFTHLPGIDDELHTDAKLQSAWCQGAEAEMLLQACASTRRDQDDTESRVCRCVQLKVPSDLDLDINNGVLGKAIFIPGW